MTDSQQLLREYVESSSDTAFRELVGRYIDLVYSVALRRTDHDTRIAEDIAQTVFTDLSKKAGTLPANVMLGGWLHQHTCFVAANMLRNEKRRTAREQQALEMNMLHDDPDESWKQLAPILDDAIEELAPAERDAVVLRFFEQRDFRSVGAALGVSDDTAQKRVSRALEKLRELLVQRGVTMGVVALGTALADRSIQAAPGELGASIANVVEHSSHVGGVASKGGSFARLMVLTSVVALLLVTVLHPEVSGRLWSLFQSREGDVAADVQSQTDGTIAALPGADSAAIASTNSIVSTEIAGTPQPNAVTNVLRLTIVADDSGKPVPNVPVGVRCMADGKFKWPKVSGNRVGIAVVPLFENTSELQLTTRIAGFADTRLLWNMERGQTIPSNYTIRLVRPVQIGGRVIGPDGQPVAGAKVGINHREDPQPNSSVESHNFDWIEVTTDSEGRWQINRIAPELLRRIYGSAEHPDFVRSQLMRVEGYPETEKELREGTHVFRLSKAVNISGIVQDSDGNPIGDAKVLCGEISVGGSRETKTSDDGSFALKGIKPGKTVLTAEAKGFAATTIPIDITTDAQSFSLKLQAGKTLRMRVVNTKGQPVVKANVWLNTMSHNFPDKDKANLVQASFDQRTDETGRILWENAPDRELQFDISANGCMRANGIKVRPGEEEHVITLQSALVISGTVKDAETGKDIPKFRVICGFPRPDGPHWSSFARDWLAFEGGKFQKSFNEPMIHGIENPGYLVKIEAEGYTPYISRTIQPTEGEVHLEVLLNPAVTPLISVFLPNGEPATLADIGLVMPGARLQMIPGGFSRENVQNSAALSQSDRRGQFRLPADEAISRVIIAHPQGCADADPADLMNNRIVHLQPWGRLEGTYRSGGKPVVGKEFTLEFGFAKADVISYSFRKRVSTDENGQFVFPQVLPGNHKIIMIVYQKEDETSGSIMHRPLQEIEIESGQTTTVDLGGTGYTVQGKFQFPRGLAPKGIQMMGFIHTAYPIPPLEIRKDRQALENWRRLPEVAEQLKSVKNIQFAEQPDGTWSAENVPAGEYSVTVHAFYRKPEADQMKTWSASKASVTVPSEPTTGILDLGEIVLQAVPQPPQ